MGIGDMEIFKSRQEGEPSRYPHGMSRMVWREMLAAMAMQGISTHYDFGAMENVQISMLAYERADAQLLEGDRGIAGNDWQGKS